MKKKLLKYVLVLTLIIGLINCGKGFAQVQEDFERSSATLTNTSSTSTGTSLPIAWTSTQADATVGFGTATGPFINNSLTYTGASASTMSAVLTGSPFSFATGSGAAWEWTFLYQTPATIVPTDPNLNTVTGNDWRFYFNANGTDPTSGSFHGYYVTQDGNFIKFYYLCGGCGSRTQLGTSFAVTAGTKYIIRAIRQSDSGGTYLFYVTQYTGPSSFPTTAVNAKSPTFDQVGSYKNSFFQSSLSTTNNNNIFNWDNLNFYQATITLSGLNNVGTGTGGNGIAAFLTQNDSQKAVFGFKATALGSVTMTNADFSWSTTGSGNQTYFTNAKLYYSSADDVYTPAADDSPLGSVDLNSASASISGLSQSMTNTSRNYFLVVDVKNYTSAATATASIGLTDVKITGNSPINIPSSVAGTTFTLPSTPTTWTGTTSDVWTLATNWNGGAPLTTSSVIIPTGLSRYPVLTANQTVGNLSMNNGSLDLGAFTLTVNNSILANGTSSITGTGNSSYLIMTGGSGDKSISGTGLKVANLKVDLPLSTNTVTLFAPVSVSNLLTVSKGIVASAGNLTLTSTTAGSGNVDVIPAGASITGNVNVQRYITGNASTSRGYRLLSSPVSVSGSNPVMPDLAYIAANTYVTGTGNTGGGFAGGGNPALYLYRENIAPNNSSFIAGNFRGISNIKNSPLYNFSLDNETGTFTIPAGNGFLLFFRGDKATTTNPTVTSTIAKPTTFTATGYLNQGDITVTHWTNTPAPGKLLYTPTPGNTNVQGYNLVGNPYASSINWDLVTTKTAVSNIIRIYNPTLKVYATYNSGTGVGANFNGGSVGNIIPSGQGFFVKATSAAAVLTFKETYKSTSQVTAAGSSLASSAQPVASPRYIRLEVFKDSVNREEALIIFKNTAKSTYVFDEDAEYLKGNSIVNLSSRSTDNVALTMNQLAFPQKSQAIPLNVTIISSGTYQIKLPEVKNIPEMYDVWLLDNYKKDSLDVKNNSSYSFNASASDTNTYGSKRFSLVVRQNPALAVHLLSFNGTRASTAINLSWNVENESNYTRYLLERTTDAGKTYMVLDSLTSAGLGVYNDIDPSPVTGLNQYRLKQTDVTGNVSYSNIVSVMYSINAGNSLANNTVNVYPNPVMSTLNLAITPTNTETAAYKITITNSTGIIVKTAVSATSDWHGDVNNLTPGSYFIQVIDTKKNTVAGKNTFIKL